MGLEGNYIFCVKKEHEEKFKIIDHLQKIKPNCKVITIDYQTGGALETILHARQFIDNNEELIISDADHYLDWDSKNFQKNMIEKKLDACAMVFPEPRYEEKSSYVTLDNNGYVTKSAEKSRISDIALAGLHYFRNGSDFTKFADDVIKKNIKANDSANINEKTQ